MKEELEIARVLALVGDLQPEDFDGHTEFASMSPEQRLNWLSQVARFIFVARDSRGERAARPLAPRTPGDQRRWGETAI